MLITAKVAAPGLLATRGKPCGLGICQGACVHVTSPEAGERRHRKALVARFSCTVVCFNNGAPFMQVLNQNVLFCFFFFFYRIQVVSVNLVRIPK